MNRIRRSNAPGSVLMGTVSASAAGGGMLVPILIGSAIFLPLVIGIVSVWFGLAEKEAAFSRGYSFRSDAVFSSKT